MGSSQDINSFCHFGTHHLNTSRKGKLSPSNSQLQLTSFAEDPNDKTVSIWLVCNDCIQKFNLNVEQDPTMNVLLIWASECNGNINELPFSLKEKPLNQYVDEFLNNSIRKVIFGNRFPVYLSDLNETEKKYFLRELEQDSTIANIFLPDIKKGLDRNSFALKLWAIATIPAKSTRRTFNAQEREEVYDTNKRQSGFQTADAYANKDEIFRSGVEVATILELIIREQPQISLEGAASNSPIRKYVKANTDDKSMKKEDLVICEK
jgi:hypothetical protein